MTPAVRTGAMPPRLAASRVTGVTGLERWADGSGQTVSTMSVTASWSAWAS